jgi:hypothetical protein
MQFWMIGILLFPRDICKPEFTAGELCLTHPGNVNGVFLMKQIQWRHAVSGLAALCATMLFPSFGKALLFSGLSLLLIKFLAATRVFIPIHMQNGRLKTGNVLWARANGKLISFSVWHERDWRLLFLFLSSGALCWLHVTLCDHKYTKALFVCAVLRESLWWIVPVREIASALYNSRK